MVVLDHESSARRVSRLRPQVRFAAVLQVALALSTSLIAIALFMNKLARVSLPERALVLVSLLLLVVRLAPVLLERLAHVEHPLVPISTIYPVSKRSREISRLENRAREV